MHTTSLFLDMIAFIKQTYGLQTILLHVMKMISLESCKIYMILKMKKILIFFLVVMEQNIQDYKGAEIRNQKIIFTVWLFKYKCALEGTMFRHKVYLYVNGETYANCKNYWNTFVPVDSLLTVWLIFILGVIKGYHLSPLILSRLFSSLS